LFRIFTLKGSSNKETEEMKLNAKKFSAMGLFSCFLVYRSTKIWKQQLFQIHLIQKINNGKTGTKFQYFNRIDLELLDRNDLTNDGKDATQVGFYRGVLESRCVFYALSMTLEIDFSRLRKTDSSREQLCRRRSNCIHDFTIPFSLLIQNKEDNGTL
jgi:hypothetical protein